MEIQGATRTAILLWLLLLFGCGQNAPPSPSPPSADPYSGACPAQGDVASPEADGGNHIMIRASLLQFLQYHFAGVGDVLTVPPKKLKNAIVQYLRLFEVGAMRQLAMGACLPSGAEKEGLAEFDLKVWKKDHTADELAELVGDLDALIVEINATLKACPEWETVTTAHLDWYGESSAVMGLQLFCEFQGKDKKGCASFHYGRWEGGSSALVHLGMGRETERLSAAQPSPWKGEQVPPVPLVSFYALVDSLEPHPKGSRRPLLPLGRARLLRDIFFGWWSGNVVDTKTTEQRRDRDSTPAQPGSLRSWAANREPPVLPRTSAPPEPNVERAQALHNHYCRYSGPPPLAGKPMTAPGGYAEYTGSSVGTGERVLLNYFSGRIYQSVTHYQFWECTDSACLAIGKARSQMAGNCNGYFQIEMRPPTSTAGGAAGSIDWCYSGEVNALWKALSAETEPAGGAKGAF